MPKGLPESTPKHLSKSTIDILGVPMSRLGFEEALAACQHQARAHGGGYVCFVNVHSSTESVRSPQLEKCLKEAFLNLADGVPLVWVSRLKRQPIRSRVCGPDLMLALVTSGREFSQGFIGGPPGLAEQLATRYGYPTCYCYSPPMRPFSESNAQADWRAYLERCPQGKSPNIVWVGLGAPKQELWMQAVAPLAPETLFLGVGAAFDFLLGLKTRAPRWMQVSGLEWVYRFVQEPRRLWRRYLINNLLFFFDLMTR